MAKDLAIILNNGSVNSAVATALAAQKHRVIMLWVETTPSQQSPSRPRAAYDLQVGHFKPYREHTLQMPWHALVKPRGGQQGNVVTDPRIQAALGPQMLELLPMLSAAARFAVHYGAGAIYTGVRIGTNGDNLAQGTEYMQIWNELLQLPCGQPELELQSPLMELETWQVIDVGFQVNAPFDRTWSCGEENSEPCWACKGCRSREAAFLQAGKPDPMRVVRKL